MCILAVNVIINQDHSFAKVLAPPIRFEFVKFLKTANVSIVS